jgi:hypothetical protein
MAEREAAHLIVLAERRKIVWAAVDAWQVLAVVHQTRGELAAALQVKCFEEFGNDGLGTYETVVGRLDIFGIDRFDGSGYPDHLKGTEIPLTARILQTVDIYYSLTTDRPYRVALSSEKALEIMWEETRRGWWDPDLVGALEQLLAESPLVFSVANAQDEALMR